MDKKGLKNADMTLSGYYESLPYCVHPKSDFVAKIVHECGVSSTTARNWIMGFTKPINKKHSEILSIITGIPVEQLWA
jgi:hypothetical protein